MKKNILSIVFLVFTFAFIYPQQYLEILLQNTLQNNLQITNAKIDYDSAVLLAKTKGDSFASSLSLSSLRTAVNHYTNSITYKQPLPGEASFQIEGSFNQSTFIPNQINNTIIPTLSLSFNQSLLPFWIVGQLEEPKKLSYQLQQEYYYNQLLYITQSVMIELIQNSVSAVSEYNNYISNTNSLNLIMQQQRALIELKDKGGINESRILELENTKMTYEQNILTSYSNYLNYIQALKSLCGTNCDILQDKNIESLIPLDYSADEFITLFKEKTGYDKDPTELSLELKIKLAENNIILTKQNGAPQICLSASVPYNKENEKFNNFSFGISLDFSPLFSSLAEQNDKLAKLELQKAKDSYNSYIIQKQFQKERYALVFSKYEEQIKDIKTLISKYEIQLQDTLEQFSQGAITQLEYENEKIRLENCYITYNNLCLELWFYKIIFSLL